MSSSTDSSAPLTRFRARLARPRASKRIDALLSTPNPAEAVEALGVTDLYFLIKEVGLVDAIDLIGLATPQQFQGCLDLEIWEKDRVQTEAIFPWLAVLMETGFEKVGQVWRHLDPELAALTIRRNVLVYDHSFEEEPPEDSELPRIETPDRFFTLEITSESDDDVRLVTALIADLYRADLALARLTLMAARSEMSSDLEEMSYRWRSGRLADLGYVDFYEALEVFRPLDPRSVKIGEQTSDVVGSGPEANRGPGDLPVPMLERVLGRPFLARALSAASPEHASRLEAALIVLVNKVLAAAKVSPGDDEAVAVGTEHATATLALGLETISRGDDDAAIRALESISLGRLHRVGYTVSMQLGRAATQLLVRAHSAGSPSLDVLAALTRSRPFFARALDSPAKAGVRPFESLHDVATVAAHLRDLGLRIALAGALGADLVAMAELEAAPPLDSHGQTAIANKIIDRDFEAVALSSGDVSALASRLADSKPIDLTEIKEEAKTRLTENALAVDEEDLGNLLSRMLHALRDELAPLAGLDIDPRFVETIRLADDMS